MVWPWSDVGELLPQSFTELITLLPENQILHQTTKNASESTLKGQKMPSFKFAITMQGIPHQAI